MKTQSVAKNGESAFASAADASASSTARPQREALLDGTAATQKFKHCLVRIFMNLLLQHCHARLAESMSGFVRGGNGNQDCKAKTPKTSALVLTK